MMSPSNPAIPLNGAMKKLPNEQATLLIAIALVILGASTRLLPHPANFAPLAAIAIFGGLYLPRKLAILVPLSAMILSDVLIGFYSWKIMLVVYSSFALTGYLSTKIRDSFAPILSVTLLSSIVFFLTTNAAVWAFGTMYSPDLSGLGQSYFMALPFFRNSLLGDLFYTGVLVGLYRVCISVQWSLTNSHTNHHTKSPRQNLW